MHALPVQSLIAPFGGRLVDLVTDSESAAELRVYAATLPSIQISSRSACDLELLATGGFSPVAAFMDRADHDRVVGEMRLADGTLFPIPLTLPVEDDASVSLDGDVTLRDAHNNLLAVLTVREIYPWDRATSGCRGSVVSSSR